MFARKVSVVSGVFRLTRFSLHLKNLDVVDTDEVSNTDGRGLVRKTRIRNKDWKSWKHFEGLPDYHCLRVRVCEILII